MQILRTLGWILLIATASFQVGATEAPAGKPITVIGIAQNAKLGAVVLSAGPTTYYLKDKSSWEPELLNKKVRVTGTLQKFELPVAVKKNGEWSAGVSEPESAYRLENFKWALE
jgi:hypothetical protein